MEFNKNQKTDIVDERQDDYMNEMHYDMQQMPMNETIHYGTQKMYGQYMMPVSMYQYPQNMYRQDNLLPFVLLGLGAYGFGSYNGYYPHHYYPPYYNPYYYPPYYNPYYGHYYHHRTN